MDVKDINLNEYEVSECLDNGNIVLRKKKSKFPTWKDLKSIMGAYIDVDSEICFVSNSEICGQNMNIFLTEKHAKSALAMAQISQLIPYYGGEMTDEELEDVKITKFSIYRERDKIGRTYFTRGYEFLAFHTAEQRDEFIRNNEQLVKDYLMIE